MTIWTEIEDEVVKRAYADGVQPSLIFINGRSRKSIIGRAFRLGLCKQGNSYINIQRINVVKRDAEIARLFGEGMPPGKIAACVGLERRAVQRSLVRSGLQVKLESPNPQSRPRVRRNDGMTFVDFPVDEKPSQPLVAFKNLEQNHCRWPHGHPDEPDFGFCGEPQLDGYSYCAQHAHIAYREQVK